MEAALSGARELVVRPITEAGACLWDVLKFASNFPFAIVCFYVVPFLVVDQVASPRRACVPSAVHIALLVAYMSLATWIVNLYYADAP